MSASSADDARADDTGGDGVLAGGDPLAGANWQRRWQPLLDQWVIVSASSAARPWSGALAQGGTTRPPAHDPGCYLCPRVTRANGAVNPDYRGAFAFDNDFPSLSFDAPEPGAARPGSCRPGSDRPGAGHTEAGIGDAVDPLTRTGPAHGRCRVLCWSERHDATLASLAPEEMRSVTRLWRDEYRTLAADPRIRNVLIFENKGTEIGVSNLHPHGQVYATDFVTDTAMRMREAQARYAAANDDASLLQALLDGDAVQSALVVERGAHHSTIVPWAARFAFETWIVPHRHVGHVGDMTDVELDDLAALYQRQVRRYDVLFGRSAPNVTLLHNAPCDDDPADAHWCFHLAFHPPLRDPDKMKFLAGFESGSNNIVNPVQPEHAAAQLRAADVASWPPAGL